MNESDTAMWMRRLAALSQSEDGLPDPALIWWQARLRERQEARARAARPLMVAQWGAAIVAAIVVGVLCVLHWASIQELAGAFSYFTWVAVASLVIVVGLALRVARE